MKKLFAFLLAGSLVAGAENATLEHTKWKLVEVSQQQIPNGVSVTLTFSENRLSLVGCNIQSGTFRRRGNSLVLTGPLRSTRKACPDEMEKLDQSFSRLISNTPELSLSATQLKLTSKDGGEWTFAREASASKNARTRFLYVAAFTKDCSGVARMKCLQVRDAKNQPWRLNYIPIQGFEHVPGIEYRLRIKEDKVGHPAADAASVAWYLDAVVEQTVVDRKAAEDYERAKGRQ